MRGPCLPADSGARPQVRRPDHRVAPPPSGAVHHSSHGNGHHPGQLLYRLGLLARRRRRLRLAHFVLNVLLALPLSGPQALAGPHALHLGEARAGRRRRRWQGRRLRRRLRGPHHGLAGAHRPRSLGGAGQTGPLELRCRRGAAAGVGGAGAGRVAPPAVVVPHSPSSSSAAAHGRGLGGQSGKLPSRASEFAGFLVGRAGEFGSERGRSSLIIPLSFGASSGGGGGGVFNLVYKNICMFIAFSFCVCGGVCAHGRGFLVNLLGLGLLVLSGGIRVCGALGIQLGGFTTFFED